MEAVALQSFQATAADELSFVKGSVLKALTLEEDERWLRVEQNGEVGIVPGSYLQVKPHSWFLPVSREGAEALLRARDNHGASIQPEGAFLIRTSNATLDDYTLSLRHHGQVQHYKISRRGGRYWLSGIRFTSLNKLVAYYSKTSITHNIHLTTMTQLIMKANRDFSPGDQGKLDFRQGDLIAVLVTSDAHWWTGEMVKGGKILRGRFPSNYVTSCKTVTKPNTFI